MCHPEFDAADDLVLLPEVVELRVVVASCLVAGSRPEAEQAVAASRLGAAQVAAETHLAERAVAESFPVELAWVASGKECHRSAESAVRSNLGSSVAADNKQAVAN